MLAGAPRAAPAPPGLPGTPEPTGAGVCRPPQAASNISAQARMIHRVFIRSLSLADADDTGSYGGAVRIPRTDGRGRPVMGQGGCGSARLCRRPDTRPQPGARRIRRTALSKAITSFVLRKPALRLL